MPRAVAEPMEERILHSADAWGLAGLDTAPGAALVQRLDSSLWTRGTAAPAAATAEQGQAPAAAEQRGTEIVFIDAGLPALDRLLPALQAEVGRIREWVLVGTDEDGFARIGAVLAGRQDISAIHLISHGRDGAVQLGRSVLDSESLLHHAAAVATWGQALSADADWLIYGCDVAASSRGLALLQDLAALTGADVAASDDRTGSALLGADWQLEQHVGLVEAAPLLGDGPAADWPVSLGSEVLANTSTTGNQSLDMLNRGSQAALAVAGDGSYVLVWTSDRLDGSPSTVLARRFAADGSALSSEIAVSVDTGSDQDQASVSTDAAGNFVVVWRTVTGGGGDLLLRRFNASGTPLAAPQDVTAYNLSAQFNPTIAHEPSGNGFVVAWQGMGSGAEVGVWLRRFDSNGAPRDGADTKISARYLSPAPTLSDMSAASESGLPSLAIDANGQVNVVYQIQNYVRWRSLNAAGALQALVTTVDNGTPSLDSAPAVAAAADGRVVIAYQTDGGEIWGRGYTASGGGWLPAVTVATDGASNADVAMLADGSFIITWQQTGGSGVDVYSRRYSASGSPIEGPTLVNTMSSGDQKTPAVAMQSPWQYAVAWAGAIPGDSSGVTLRTFQNTAPNWTTSASTRSVAENTSAVGTVTATDADLPAQTLTYTLAGGADVSRFSINAANGALAFVQPPNHEAPADANGDNVYELSVRASDGTDSSLQTLQISVTNANEAPVFSLPPTQSTPVNQPLVFSTATGNAIALSDPDAGSAPLALTLAASAGSLSLDWSLSGAASPLGNEWRVNTTTSDRQATLDNNTEFYGAATDALAGPRAVALNDDGSGVAVWSSKAQDGSGWGVYGQRFGAGGSRVGAEFAVTQATALDQLHASVARAQDGSFVVVWASKGQDGDDWGIFARRFGASGNALGAEFQVNSVSARRQIAPDVAMAPDGRFVVTWVTEGRNYDAGFGIAAQRFAADGSRLAGEFAVNTATAKDQTAPTVAMASDGRFVIAWSSDGVDGSGWSVQARRYEAEGFAAGGEFTVNTTTNKDQYQPRVAVDGLGRFTIAWTSQDQDGDAATVVMQRFDAAGNRVDGEMQVNQSTAKEQWQPALAVNASGRIALAWASRDQDGSGWSIVMRQFYANGSNLSSEVLVNTTSTGDQRFPALAMNNRGDLVVAWSGNGSSTGQTDSQGVFARSFGAASAVTLVTGDGTRDSSLALQGSASALTAALQGLRFEPAAGFAGSAGITLSADDQGASGSGSAQSGTGHIGIAVSAAGLSLAPQIALDSGPLVWTEGDPPLAIAPLATLSDSDSSQFANGRLVVFFAAGGSPEDRLLVLDSGSGATAVANSGGTLSVDGTVVGLASGGQNGSPLVVQLLAAADSAKVQTLLRALAFSHNGEDPGDAQRIIGVQMQDGAGGISPMAYRTLDVLPVNDPPTVTSFAGAASAGVQLFEGTSAVATLSATDPDLGSFGALSWSISGGADAARFAVDAATGAVTFVAAPDHEAPADADGDNRYEVLVSVSDGVASASQALQVDVQQLVQTPLANADLYTLPSGQSSSTPMAQGWFDAAWSTRQFITLDTSKGLAALTDTPLALMLTGSTVDMTRMQHEGVDLRFVGANGALLSHDVDTWGLNRMAHVWVRVPDTSALVTEGGATGFWMYYGNPNAPLATDPAGVWGDARAVVHLGQLLEDATPHANPVAQTATTVQTGKIANARAFDGADSSVSLGSGTALDNLFAQGGTVSAWIKPSGWGEAGYGRIASKANGSPTATTDGWSWEINLDTRTVVFEYGFSAQTGVWRAPIDAVALNQWTQVTLAYDASSAANRPTIYLNGSAVPVTVVTAPAGIARSDAAMPLTLGNHAGAPERAFEGLIDEFRAYGTLRSAAQVAADWWAVAGAAPSLGPALNGPPGVLNNDHSPDGVPMVATLYAGPSHASAFSLSANGSFSYTPYAGFVGTDTFVYRVSAGNSGEATATVTLRVEPANAAPTITSPPGGNAAALTVAENTQAVATLVATDADSADPRIWALAGGADETLFRIKPLTGVLTFAEPPDHEAPADADADNVYQVRIQVSDGRGGADTQDLSITVTDVGSLLTVTTAADLQDGNTASVEALVANPGPDGKISLREAILAANATTGKQRIAFHIGGGGAQQIVLASALPPVTDPVLIDGSSQPGSSANSAAVGSSAVLGIGLRAASGGGLSGLVLAPGSDGSRINGIAFGGFTALSTGGAALVLASDNNVVDGNFFGWAPDGLTPQPNTVSVALAAGASGNTIGGQSRLARNVFGPSSEAGIVLAGSDNAVYGNEIGGNAAGVAGTGAPGSVGVLLRDGAVNNHIGGIFPNWGNRIHGWDDGIAVEGAASQGNTLRGNTLFGNWGEAIDLGRDGPTANDLGDVDTGPNALQNYPDFNSAWYSNGSLRASGALLGASAGTWTLDFYGADPANGSNPGSAEVYLGQYAFEADGSAIAPFSFSLQTADMAAGWRVSATATSPDGNTSELMAGVAARATNAPAVLLNPQLSAPENQTDAGVLVASDSDGDLVAMQIDGGADAGLFTLNLIGKQLRFLSAPDHEAPADANGDNVYELNLWVTDGLEPFIQPIQVRVLNVNEPPQAGAALAAAAAQDQAFSWRPPADWVVDPDSGDNLHWTATQANGSALPGWLAVDAATGTLSGLPRNGDVGSLLLRLTATDRSGRSAAGELALTVANVNDPPVITSGGGGAVAAYSVPENTQAVTTVTATDADPGSSLSYRIAGGADAAQFALDPQTGVLRFVTAPDADQAGDADANHRYELRVEASDGLAVATQDITVSITPVNEPPQVNGSPLAMATTRQDEPWQWLPLAGWVSDPDPGDGLRWSANLADGSPLPAWISLDSATGGLSGKPGNAEVGSLTLALQASDSADLSASVSLSLTVSNVNDPPVIAGAAPQWDVGVLENSVDVRTVTASDVDSGSRLNWALGGADAAQFMLDTATGVLRFASAPDAERPTDANADNVYELLLTVSDGELSSSQALSVRVQPLPDEPPRIANAGGSASTALRIPEPGHAASLGPLALTVLQASDGDLPPQTLRWSISGGADAALFRVDPASGALGFAAAPDFEVPRDADANNVYQVQLTVTDDSGAAASQTLSVEVVDRPEAPLAGAIAWPDASVQQDQAFNWAPPPGSVKDPDAGERLRWSATQSDGSPLPAWLQIDPADGRLSGTPTQAEVGAWALRLTATDTTGLAASMGLAVHVADVDDPPVIDSGGGAPSLSLTVLENQRAVTVIQASDPDPAAQLVYAIDGGADAAWFSLDPRSGALQLVQAPDAERPTDADRNLVYDLRVRVDSGPLSATQVLRIAVLPVNEAPSGLDASLAAPADGRLVLRPADFGFADAPGERGQLAAVRLGLPEAGRLLLDGQVLGVPTEVTADRLAAGALVWAAPADYRQRSSAGLDFQVRDDGGNADGGIDLDPTPNRLVLNLGSINTAPQPRNDNASNLAALQFPAGTSLSVPISALLANDQDADGDSLSLLSVGDADRGTVQRLGERIQFTPAAGWVGAAGFRYTVDDGHGGQGSAWVAVDVLPAVPLPALPTLAAEPEPAPAPTPSAPAPAPAPPAATAATVSDSLRSSASASASRSNSSTGNNSSAAPTAAAAATALPDDGTAHISAGPAVQLSLQLPELNGMPSSLPTARALGLALVERRDLAEHNSPGGLPAASGNLAAASTLSATFEPLTLDALSLASLARAPDLGQGSALARAFDQVQEQMADAAEAAPRTQVVASGMAVGTGVSIGYVVWLLRSGALLSSVLSALPAWQLLDPLPVLARSNLDGDGDDDAQADDVERLFGAKPPAPPPPAQPPTPPDTGAPFADAGAELPAAAAETGVAR